MRRQEVYGRPLRLTACVTLLALSGCASLRERPVDCRVATGLVTAAVGAAVGAVIDNEVDGSPDGISIAAAGLGGFVAGGLAGYGLGYWLCPVPPEPAPPAPPPPAPAPTPAPVAKLVLRGVTFDFDRATIRPDARPVLDEAARALTAAPATRIVVEGHTDAIGSDAYNLRLSERRARAVADYLAAAGVAPERMEVVGVGKARPVASNETADGRAQNRRVEIRVRE